MIKIGDIVRLKNSGDASAAYKVAGVKSNFRGLWISLCADVKQEGVKAYPFKSDKVWMRSQDFEVIERK